MHVPVICWPEKDQINSNSDFIFRSYLFNRTGLPIGLPSLNKEFTYLLAYLLTYLHSDIDFVDDQAQLILL